MDVANVTSKNFVESGSASKGGSSAEQLLVDFSAAVAARMSSVGGKAAEQGKNALANHLTPKTQVTAPQEDSAPPPREDITDALPAQSREDRADKAPVDTSRDDHADDYNAPASAPREVASHDNRDSKAHAEPSHSDTGAADNAPHDGGNNNAQNAPSDAHSGAHTQSQAGSKAEAVIDPAMTAAVLPVDTGKADQVLSTVAAKAETAVTATGDNAPKQNALNGLNTAQDAAAKNNATPGEAQNGDEQQADVNAKGKRGAQQAAAAPQATQNAAQAKGEGPSTAQQQAADLSRAVGQENRLNVNVSVTKQANELTSQPTQNLTAQVVQVGEGDNAAANATQSAGKGQGVKLTPTQNTGQNGAEGQAQGQKQNQGQGQAQAQGLMQAQLQATQGDAVKAAVGGEAKSISTQAANAANAAQTVKAGGAEVTTPTPTATASNATTQTHQAAAPAKPQPTPHTPARPQVTDQVTVQISKAIADGMDTIRIQLKPAHLGRVDVSLEMGQDGRVSAVITADNKETLDLLKQDSRELQKALREAGLQMGSNDMSFNLRGEGGKANGDQEPAQGNSTKTAAPLHEPSLEELLQAQTGPRNIITKDRVDITA